MPFKKDLERFQKFVDYYDLPESEKLEQGITTHKALCQKVGITEQCGYNWKKQIEKERTDPNESEFEEYKAMMKECAFGKKATAKDRENYGKLFGWYIEKREDKVKFEFTTSDRIRIARETLAQLREQYQSGGGYCPVCQRPQALYEGTYLDTDKSETAEDSEVGSVAVSA